jgi:hypothetical protein
MYRDNAFRIAYAKRHADRRPARSPEGSLRRKEVAELRASEHKRDLERFYREVN